MIDQEIDVTNDHFVGVSGFGVVIAAPPLVPMSRDEALRLAAWLVALADPDGARFASILAAVLAT